MSRTLKSLESSGAALAALCIVGASSQANALTVPAFVAHDSNIVTDIYINGSATPQFAYNSFIDNFITGDQKAFFDTRISGQIATSLSNSNGNTGTANASFDSSATYHSNFNTKVSDQDHLSGSGYVQLAFDNGGGPEYGYASFNLINGDLLSITGDTVTSVRLDVETPLPASWALLLSGTALFGLVAQGRRRRKVAA